MHWATQYVGLPYKPTGRDHDGVDCWGLVYLIYKEQLNIELPLFPGVEFENVKCVQDAIKQGSSDWVECLAFNGAVVLMAQAQVFHHIGISINGRILHAIQGPGVVFEGQERLLQIRCFKRFKFYRHKLWPTSS